MKTANRELLDRLAAEYALGTLRGRARRRFERWLLSPRVAALVRAWEERLAFLEPRDERIAPPPAGVWRDIETRLELRKLERNPARRWMGLVASVLVFTLLAVFLIA
jgi:anti-sigma-K factor RskA